MPSFGCGAVNLGASTGGRRAVVQAARGVVGGQFQGNLLLSRGRMLHEPTATGSSGEFPRAFGALALLKQLARDERPEVFLALRPEGADRLCVVTLLGSVLTAESHVVDAMRAQATWLVGRV